MSLEDVQTGKGADSLRRFTMEPLLAGLIRRLLAGYAYGTLTVTLPSGAEICCRGPLPGPDAHIVLEGWGGLWRLIFGGDIGFGQAYMAGDWSTADLPLLLESLLRNENALAAAWQGSTLTRLPVRLRHRLRANTRRGSRRNIEAHYDLGNEFYAAWLDAGMNYSSALYADPHASLEDAQIAKLDRVIGMLAPQPGDHILEIGCGWGALAERLAVGHACAVTGITLSREQQTYAQRRLEQAGAARNTSIRLQDYRDLSGSFDAIVSIEMLEAAGEDYWPVYFEKLGACLKPGGVAVLQVITIEESRFPTYRRRPDFIQRHIFPGGMLPTIGIVERQVAAAGLSLNAIELFGDSYVRTLAEWRSRFLRSNASVRNSSEARQQFRRMWDYYLAYCEAGFRTGALNVGLYQVIKR